MAGRQAKTLSNKQLAALLRPVKAHSDPLRSRLMILLSIRAGLRAAEIAKLEWPMVLGPTGTIGQVLEIRDRIAKKKLAAAYRYIQNCAVNFAAYFNAVAYARLPTTLRLDLVNCRWRVAQQPPMLRFFVISLFLRSN